MTKALFYLLPVLLWPALTVAQEEPSKPDYEKRVFVDGDRYYVQKSLPVYLQFSVSPDGEQYPLKSEQNPEDANPLYLDTEGVNYIRSKWAVDPETGRPVSPPREVMMELYADGLAPRTVVNFRDARVYRSGGTVFYGPGLHFELSARDGVSGVRETQYALGGNYQSYKGSVEVTKEGPQRLFYFSADQVGNTEKTHRYDFSLDLTPPSSNHSIEGISHNQNVLAPSTRFRLSASDKLSGVNRVMYNFDQGSLRTYGNVITMAGLQDGEHSLYYYGIDNVNNQAEPREFKFYLDRIPPVVEHEILGDMYVGDHRYVSARTEFKLTATDNKAGVKEIYYQMDGGTRAGFSSAQKFPGKLGWHKLIYYAEDNVENRSGAKSVSVYLDNRAPETSISYGNPQFFARDTLFITSQTQVRLQPRDAHSGVKATNYSVDGGTQKDYSPFSLQGEGHHSLSFNSTDRVNNTESEKSSRCFVDNTAPEIYVNFSIEPIGTREGLKVYPNYVRMYVGATDRHVGTEDILYSIDGAALRAYSSPRTLDISELDTFKKRKKYEVKVVAKDKLGNQSEKLIEFYVGRE